MDTIANLLTSLRNAEMAGHQTVSVPASKMSKAILQILQENGYISSFLEEEKKFLITFKQPLATHHYKRVSKPGRRIYTDAQHIPTVLRGRGMVILSSSQGVISGKEAKKRQVGGEIVCEVY